MFAAARARASLEGCDGIDGRAGSANDRERCDREQELVAFKQCTGLDELVEVRPVEQGQSHGSDAELVER
jgi:hypothetical protein